MINGIKPIITKPVKEKSYLDSLQTTGFSETNGLSFDEAMDNLLVKIDENYQNWGNHTKDKTLDLNLMVGRKFIKVVKGSSPGQRSVWGFIVKEDTAKFKKGDILMAAGWSAPATNKARGNIFEESVNDVQWTGPRYLF